MDDRQAKALMQALKSTAGFLGKESEYLTFVEYVTWSEMAEPKPSLEQIAANTPMWIQLLSPPLRILYASGYDSGPSPLGASSIMTSSLSDCGMEPLEKLEIIVKYDLAEKKGKRESTNHSSNLYVLGLDHEISMLEEIMFAINAIKHNHYSVSDEMISKMFCSG